MRTLSAMILSLVCVSCAVSSRVDCPEGELQFSFEELQVRMAFALFADFAGLQVNIDQSLVEAEPMNFGCTHWKTAAEDLARRHDLRLEIRDGVMYVSKR